MGTVRLRLLLGLCVLCLLSELQTITGYSSCSSATDLYVYAPSTQKACCYYGWVNSGLMTGADNASPFKDVRYCGKETIFSAAATDYANFTAGSTMYEICSSRNCSSSGLTEVNRCCVYNDTTANVSSTDTSPYFQVPSIAVYLCPYADTETRAFGFDIPAAGLPANSTPWAKSAANPVTKQLLSKCPNFDSAVGNYSVVANRTGAGNTSLGIQTISIPVSSDGNGLEPEAPYALLIQRKAAVQQVTITFSMYVDGDPAYALFEKEVLTLYPSTDPPPKTRRRGLLAATTSSQWMDDADQGMDGMLVVAGRQLMKGGGGGGGKGGGSSGGGKSGGSSGGKTSGGSKTGSGKSGSGASVSGGSGSGKTGSYRAVKARDLVKGGVYASKRSKNVGVNYYGSVGRSRYRFRGNRYVYRSTPTAAALAFGLPLLFTAWFLTAPLAMWYGYTAWSLFQQAHTFNYITPTDWMDLPSTFSNYTCPASPGALPINGSDCLAPYSQTCCGQPFQNAKFTPIYTIPGFTYRGTKLTCPLRSDLVMEYPVVMPQNAKTLQLVIHGIEAVLGVNSTTASCGDVAQILNPQEPPLYVSFLKVEPVNTNGAGGRQLKVGLVGGVAAVMAWLMVLV